MQLKQNQMNVKISWNMLIIKPEVKPISLLAATMSEEDRDVNTARLQIFKILKIEKINFSLA